MSGGLSSSIAGGNFWDGVQQGLITSGLNHGMHSVANKIYQKSVVDKVLTELGLNPKDEPETSIKSIKKLLQHPKVNEQYELAGSPDLEKDLTVHNEYKPFTYGEINFENGKIEMYKASFKNWRTLTLKTVHEFRHRYHYVSGLYDNWIEITGHFKSH